jgi:MFS family permease
MQSLAVGWLVVELTGSAWWLGVVTAVRFVPSLVVGLPAGLLADRRDRRLVMVWTSLGGALAAAILALVALADVASLGWLLAATLISGIANAVEAPARQAYVAELAGAERRAGAIAMNSLIFNGARVAGPAVAGIVVALAGPAPVFVANALSYAAVVAALLALRHRPAPREVAGRGAYRELVSYLRATPAVTWLLVLIGAQTMLASGHLYLGPAIARDLGAGAEGLGILMSGVGFGAVLAGLRLAVRPAAPEARRTRRPLVLAVSLTGLASLGVALSLALPTTAGLFGLVAAGSVSFNVTTNSRVQAIVPDRLRGRVMSLYSLMLLGLIPPGSLALGALGDAIGAANALAVGGLAWLAVALPALLLVPGLRDAPRPPAG